MVYPTTEADVRAYLDRLGESGVLGRSTRRPALLEYLLLAELNGDGGSIKAYSIGVDIFDKPEDFDPTTDSSVRVEVGRLRTSLALFEASDFADTRLLVNIPVGTYRPEITLRDPELLSTPSHPDTHGTRPQPLGQPTTPGRRSGRVYWVTFLFALIALGLSGFAALNWLTEAPVSGPPIRLVVDEFEGKVAGRELSTLVKDGFSNIEVVSVGNIDKLLPGIDYFGVTGNVTDLFGVVRVGVELENLKTDEVVWSHVFDLDPDKDLKEEIDTKLNGELETRLIGAAKRLLERRDVNDLTPEQLFVLGTWISGPAISSLAWETERVRIMTLALAKNPEFGPAHSVLADKYGFLANMHPDWDTKENLDLARYHAERAIELSPLDANAMFNVAQSLWHTGRHAESSRVFRRVTELDGGNALARFFARVVPYWCGQVPDDVMAWAVAFDQSLSQDDPIRWIVLTWISTLHTNRGEYDLALEAVTEATRIFQVGYTYMLHSMLLNKAGEPKAARAVVERQLVNWPGIDAVHYVGSTVPRLCLEQDSPTAFLADYSELGVALEGLK